ncbi:armadillo repeat-containing protein 2 [Nematolebias whitei]|uniref:armadillo repeat-containing protein 2 n=1 Tax=Nematolebias whitei TaxID=451745 RepID=UPI0018987219|nr:armadillo repeat-containing protein 2 [Nematolebias whitei]
MSSMETKHEICSPFVQRRRNSLRKTCAEIVNESRQSLRVQSTQRPFTPQDGHRQLFGRNSVRTDSDSRPSSTFSLHGQNFDASDSRPGSGTRLSPLNHKPKLPAPFKAQDSSKEFPKSPSCPVDTRRGLAHARSRLLKPLTTLLPSEVSIEVKEKLNPGPEQKQQSAEQLCRPEQSTVHNDPPIPGPCKSSKESRKTVQPGVDSGVILSASRAKQQTELRHEDNATSAKEEAESLVWNNVIVPFLEELESVAAGSSDGSVDRLCDLCDGLHGTLADADMLGRRCKRRSKMLRTLFRLIDLNSSKLNLHIAKLCLALSVSGNNLLNICKLIFQISQSESNDILFQENAIIDSLLDVLYSEDVNVSGEALLYCVGALKFLSGNTAILRLLLDKNCMDVAQKLLQVLCAVDDTCLKTAGHILVQLTATLRNLADHPDSRALFVSFSILPVLCQVLHHHCEDKDICTNISRIFSKLSSYSQCCLALAQIPNCYPLFLELLSKHHRKQDLVVRLLFTLGNLTARSDAARLQLFQCSGCMATLLQLYSSYQRRDESPLTPSSPRKPATPPISAREADDVLVKLVRVLANVCIHPTVGPSLVANPTCVQLLMETLELRSMQESEELMVNVAATFNNLSFYQEESSTISHNRLAITKLMLKLMLSSSMEAVLEATRVYGNLSQHRDVRDFVMQNKVHKFAVTLLDSKRAEMCFSACGVLTNLALDPPKRVSLALEGTSAKLVDCLRDLGAADWQLAGQACQAMWNLTGGGSEELLDTEDRQTLLKILTEFLDEEEVLKWVQNEDMRDFHRACWELEFQPVAQKLLKALQSQDLTA